MRCRCRGIVPTLPFHGHIVPTFRSGLQPERDVGMFDWDRDHAETVAHRPIPPPPQAPAPPGKPRGWQGQWLGPVAAGGALALGLSAFHDAAPPPAPMQVSISAFGTAPPTHLRPAEPRIVLHVYDDALAERFTRGLARFDTQALRAYAAQTRRDIDLRNQPMGADLADALTLIEAELARRGGG
jgi:hypothetical protein